jgi:phosphatidylglycerol:prolipoprotein diacylglycerol transferase
MFESTGRIAFYVGNYPIMKYGITMGLAIASSVLILLYIRKKYYDKIISEDSLFDLCFYVLIFGIIGARLWYVLLNIGYYSNNLCEILMINKGGISIQGSIIGGVLAGLYYTRKKHLSFAKIADLFAFAIPIGQAIGRWGNFFNSEAFGKPCDLPWKLYIPENCRPSQYIDYEFFHPTFLYESIFNVLIFLILFFVLRKVLTKYAGATFCCYIILYSFVRIFIEFIRIDSVLNVFNIPIAVIVACIFIVLAVVSLFSIYKSNELSD